MARNFDVGAEVNTITMAVVVDCRSASAANEGEIFHSIPCRIEHDGKAKVQEYFSVGIRTETSTQTSEQEMRASFRGRPLHGKEIDVLAGWTGVVLKENRKPFNDEEDRSFKISHSFKKYNYWNLDLSPSDMDKLPQALDWINLADVLHSPIDSEEISKP